MTLPVRLTSAAEHLGQQALESYLWGGANLLRGLIDAGDYSYRLHQDHELFERAYGYIRQYY